MSELKLSITVLVSYVIVVLGVANIDVVQESVIDFSPIFFILIGAAIFSELIVVGYLISQGVRMTNYIFISFWAAVYSLIWIFYWKNSLPVQVQIIQFLLVELGAGLAYDVGKRVGQIDNVLEGLSSSAYPNQIRDIKAAQDIITNELTRSRRYHHTLPILVIRLEKGGSAAPLHYELLGNDILERFAIAKIGQILSDLSRNTDIIVRDRDGLFIIICPETSFENLPLLAGRIAETVNKNLGTTIKWGSALFPDEALTFEELLQTARARLEISDTNVIESVAHN
jgi:GGDEF domain-containing protein